MKRLNRIFKDDGKTVIIAMDHGMGLHVNPSLDDTGNIIGKILEAGADGILTTYGIACKYESALKDIGLILRVDGGYSALNSSSGAPCPLFSVEDALIVGADAVACMGFPGIEGENITMMNLSKLVADGKKWGMPVVAEMLPGGFSQTVPVTMENIRLAVRTGCEYGANVIKTSFMGDGESYKQIIEASYQPVIVLGGEKTKNLPELFECIEMAMEAGAAGVAIGRNVWKHEHPELVVKALVELVHDGKKAKDIDYV